MHPLDGCRAKICRAGQHINALDAEFREFTKPEFYKIIRAEINPKTGKQTLRISSPVNSLADIPSHWSVVVGEICHDLRSSLDYLTCQLTILDTRNTKTCDENISFPIYLFGPRKGKGAKRWPPQGVPHGIRFLCPCHATSIKRLQPYQGRNGQRLSPLWLLQELNNADKHRQIQVLTSQARGFTLRSGKLTEMRVGLRGFTVTVNGIRLKTGMPLINRTKVGTVAADETMDVNQGIRPQIGFAGGCDAVKRLPVIRTLESMTNEVSSIIEFFAPDF